jgi:sigma-B regulation protein RsbU (phosphoserine phosphatase)
MAPTTDLRKLLNREKDLSAAFKALIETVDGSAGIYDNNGTLLLGSDAGTQKIPLHLEEEQIGWLAGSQNTETLSSLVTYFLAGEIEKKKLGREVLDRYRELNLLYDLSAKLTVSLEPAVIAGITISEAQKLLKNGTGIVLLKDEDTGLFVPLTPNPYITEAIDSNQGIIGSVVSNDRAEIVNEVQADSRTSHVEHVFSSLACAPLKAKQQVIGVVVIGNPEPVQYTAADLKFLSAIVSQAAPAIEHALLYAKTIREAQEREEKLERELTELRIEIDRVRQAKQVAEITGTEYFQSLRDQAKTLRANLE